MTYCIVFLANVLTDMLAVTFIQEVTDKNRIKVGLVSAAIVSLGALSMIYIIQDAYYIFPTALGAFIGSYIKVGRK